METAGEPVLVIFVDDPRDVAKVRSAVAGERVVAERPGAFALRDGRIIASVFDVAGDLVSDAGWVDRELQPIHVRRQGEFVRTANDAGARKRELAPGELAELLAKPTLARGEALRLIDQI